MRQSRILFLSAISLLSFHNLASAAAFEFYEVGTPVIGTAGVGQAAESSDASTTYFNPAGMTQLKKSEFMVGSQIIIPNIHFSPNNQNTISGNNGDNAASLTPGIGLYYVNSYYNKLRFGVSVNSPYGGWLNYNDGWVGRYHVQYEQFYTIDLNPTVAYQINDWASIGIGGTVEYANLNETVAIPSADPLIDGQGHIKVDNYAGGFNAGLLLTPCPTTKIGIAYRSRITHSMSGTSTFLRLAVTPATTVRMIIPQNVIASISQDIKQLTLLGEAGWANWGSTVDTLINLNGFSASIPRSWHDTYRLGLGAQYRMTPCLQLQAGVSYDSSPTSASKRLPDLPMDRQIRAGTGFIYQIMQGTSLSANYEYIDLGKAAIHNNGRIGTLAGSYHQDFASVVSASINFVI